MSTEASKYAVHGANENRLKAWLKAGQWTREEAVLLLLGIDPASVTAECFMTFNGEDEIQYEFLSHSPKERAAIDYDENGEPLYLSYGHEALFDRTMAKGFGLDLQLNSVDKAEPIKWIELAREEGIAIPWLDWAIEKGLYIQKVEPDAESTAPVVGGSEDALIQWQLMATAEKLIAAFGSFSGMNKAWFNALKYKPQLKAARYKAGVGGRGGTKPLFYVFPVMEWLADPKNKVGSKMKVSTGWHLLKAHFPKVYEQYEDRAPDPD